MLLVPARFGAYGCDSMRRTPGRCSGLVHFLHGAVQNLDPVCLNSKGIPRKMAIGGSLLGYRIDRLALRPAAGSR